MWLMTVSLSLPQSLYWPSLPHTNSTAHTISLTHTCAHSILLSNTAAVSHGNTDFRVSRSTSFLSGMALNRSSRRSSGCKFAPSPLSEAESLIERYRLMLHGLALKGRKYLLHELHLMSRQHGCRESSRLITATVQHLKYLLSLCSRYWPSNHSEIR